MAEPKNPYDKEAVSEADEVVPGRAVLWGFVGAFFVFLITPWAWQLIQKETMPPGRSGGVLKRAEAGVESLTFFEEGRENDQALALRLLREGNRRVHPGRGGWLFYWPDLEAVTGKGPYYEQPLSVARERVVDTWESPVKIVKEFAAQLDERGITLFLVPVPTKAMMCPEPLGIRGEAPVIPPVYRRLVEDLSGSGMEVIDLVPELSSLPLENRFLRADTHWTPEAMFSAAALVTERVSLEFPKGALETSLQVMEKTHEGDLAGMLLSDQSMRSLGKQNVALTRVTAADSGEPLLSDESSPLVVLGDSFVNIFEDPDLGFSGDAKIGAGFASHFAAAMKHPVHTIAINGDGATGVRRAFASLPDEAVRSKKVVVWVFSARDLLLAELAARRANIRWAPVTFREAEAREAADPKPMETEAGQIIFEATLSERTVLSDPQKTPYEDAIFSVLVNNIAVERGAFEGEEAYLYLWGFQDRVFSETAGIEVGKRYRFTVVPFREAPGISSATQVDDLFRTDLDPWFATSVELLE